MLESLNELDLLRCQFIAVLSVALGLTRLRRPRPETGTPHRTDLALGLLLSGVIAGAFWLGWPSLCLSALGFVLGLWWIVLLLQHDGIRAFVHRLLEVSARPLGQTCALVCGGLVLFCGSSILLSVTSENICLVPSQMTQARPPLAITSHHAHTDRGKAVELHHPTGDYSVITDDRLERDHYRDSPLALRMIRTGPMNPHSNCHGWVFTGGQYWLHKTAVEDILRDNGYAKIIDPQPGDLVIYREEEEIVHTALVRFVSGDLVMLESKWGHTGTYLHLPVDQPYGSHWEFYRSPRAGHLIQGLSEIDTVSPQTRSMGITAAIPRE